MGFSNMYSVFFQVCSEKSAVHFFCCARVPNSFKTYNKYLLNWNSQISLLFVDSKSIQFFGHKLKRFASCDKWPRCCTWRSPVPNAVTILQEALNWRKNDRPPMRRDNDFLMLGYYSCALHPNGILVYFQRGRRILVQS